MKETISQKLKGIAFHYGTRNLAQKSLVELSHTHSIIRDGILYNESNVDDCDVCEAIADSLIVLRELEILFGQEKIAKIIEFKLNDELRSIRERETLTETESE